MAWQIGFGRCSDPAIINLITRHHSIIQEKVSTKYVLLRSSNYGICMYSKVNMGSGSMEHKVGTSQSITSQPHGFFRDDPTLA